jgi:type VI protein secretion system component Hcp
VLHRVRLTGVSTGGSGGEDRLTENVSFAYASVVEAYQQQEADGSLGPAVFGGGTWSTRSSTATRTAEPGSSSPSGG